STGRNYFAGGLGGDTMPAPTASPDLYWGASGDDTFVVNDPTGGDIHLGGLGSDLFGLTTLNFDLIDGGYNNEAAPHPVMAAISAELTGDTVQFGNTALDMD